MEQCQKFAYTAHQIQHENSKFDMFLIIHNYVNCLYPLAVSI